MTDRELERAALEDTREAARALAAEARAIRRSLDSVGAWNRARTLKLALLGLLVVVLAVHLHEVGRMVCGHGVPGQGTTTPPTVYACEIAWPEGTSRPGEQWPTGANLLGLALYAVGVAVGARAYARAGLRREEVDERPALDAEVDEEARA